MSNTKPVLGILSYNNPIFTDRLVENIQSSFDASKYNMIVLDNGSDGDKISKYTTHKITTNCRMTCGFNKIIDIANEFYKYDHIWFFTNDCYFVKNTNGDILNNMLNKFSTIKNLGILHPCLSKEVIVCYDVKEKNKSGVEIVCNYDFVCPMFSKQALDSIGGKFDKNLYLGWGIDYESSFLVRKNNLLVGINHDIVVMHNTSATYDMKLDNKFKDRNAFYDSAGTEMRSVFNNKYGYNWFQIFTTNYTNNIGEWHE